MTPGLNVSALALSSRATYDHTRIVADYIWLDAGAEVISGQRIMLVGFVETADVLREKLLWEKQRQSSRRRPDRGAPP